MWSYPIGAIIGGVELTERTVRPALPVIVGDVQYGESIFSAWSLPELAALGIKLFVENPIPQDYIGGVPVDIETDTQITRTYPDMKLDTGAAAERQKQSLYAELASLDVYMPRAVEDIVAAAPDLYAALPQVNKDRIARKQEIRSLLLSIQTVQSDSTVT